MGGGDELFLNRWMRLKDEARRPVTIAAETPDQPEISAFLAASDAYSQSLYPPESNHLVDLSVLTATNAHFLVARRGNEAVGCGALITKGASWGELKRMWVSPAVRGRGLGRRLVEAIEAEARTRGIKTLRLETGIYQLEAIGLYRKCGFAEREPFGDYQPDPLSLFMEKQLD